MTVRVSPSAQLLEGHHSYEAGIIANLLGKALPQTGQQGRRQKDTSIPKCANIEGMYYDLQSTDTRERSPRPIVNSCSSRSNNGCYLCSICVCGDCWRGRVSIGAHGDLARHPASLDDERKPERAGLIIGARCIRYSGYSLAGKREQPKAQPCRRKTTPSYSHVCLPVQMR